MWSHVWNILACLYQTCWLRLRLLDKHWLFHRPVSGHLACPRCRSSSSWLFSLLLHGFLCPPLLLPTLPVVRLRPTGSLVFAAPASVRNPRRVINTRPLMRTFRRDGKRLAVAAFEVQQFTLSSSGLLLLKCSHSLRHTSHMQTSKFKSTIQPHTHSFSSYTSTSPPAHTSCFPSPRKQIDCSKTTWYMITSERSWIFK